MFGDYAHFILVYGRRLEVIVFVVYHTWCDAALESGVSETRKETLDRLSLFSIVA